MLNQDPTIAIMTDKPENHVLLRRIRILKRAKMKAIII
jgi:hypothetical protein